MAFLFKPPEGAVVEAIWRCKRGHESCARVKMPPGGPIIPENVADMLLILHDGTKIGICLQCIAEDYGCELVEFGHG